MASRFPLYGRPPGSRLNEYDPVQAKIGMVVAAARLKARKAAIAEAWTPEDYQHAPEGEWRNWLLMGGRGSGKTAAGANAIDEHAKGPACLKGKVPHRMAIVAPTHDDAVDTCVRGETGLLSLDPEVMFRPGSRLHATLTWPNRSEAELFGCFTPEDVERFRGPQHCFVWGDEFAAWRKLDEAWPMIDFGLRLGSNPRRVLTTTPKPRPQLKSLVKDASTITTIVTTDQNKHLPEARRGELYAAYAGTTMGRQELNAELLGDMPGALWTRQTIDDNRRIKAPELGTIVVAIDPSVTSGEDADECGIIVVGIDHAEELWVLDDISTRTTPLGWATRAVGAYRDHEADKIVGEVNNGGEMVGLTIHTVDDKVVFVAVTASRGKRTRAEPIAALYEQGKVHHVGAFPELEDQMCTWEAGDADSPDRMDALVWGCTALLENRQSILSYYRTRRMQQSAHEGATA